MRRSHGGFVWRIKLGYLIERTDLSEPVGNRLINANLRTAQGQPERLAFQPFAGKLPNLLLQCRIILGDAQKGNQ